MVESENGDGRMLWGLPSRENKWTQDKWALGSLLDGVQASRPENICCVTCASALAVRFWGIAENRNEPCDVS